MKSALVVGSWLLAGAAGYWLGAGRSEAELRLRIEQSVPFEYLFNERSFSEIENTKSKLEAHCTELLTELRVRHGPGALVSARVTGPVKSGYTVDLQGAIQELQKGVRQFAGTDQQGRLVRELLSVLKRLRNSDAWVDTYLTFLYEHPTDPLVAKLAGEAAQMADDAGRGSELTEALDVVERIRLALAAKHAPLTHLDQTSPEPGHQSDTLIAAHQSAGNEGQPDSQAIPVHESARF